MNRGYFKTWRKITESAVFQNEGLLKVFIWCLAKAAYKDAFVTVRTGRGISEVKIVPGSFLFGRHSASKELHMSPSTVWKRILKLKKLEILNIESNSHYSIIYIINWPFYQADIEKGDIESDRQVTGKEHKEEIKEIKNIFIVPSIEDVSAYCKERNNSINPQTFIDHYTATGWMIGKNKMKNWRAAVRTWESKNLNPEKQGSRSSW